MNKLYPPQIEGTIPAFTGTTIVVPFAMNKAVVISEVKALELKVKTVQNDAFLFTVRSFEITQCAGSNYEVKFHFDDFKDKLKLSSFYKLQLAYIDQNDMIGYYSTVGVAKYTTSPKVDIDNLDDPIGLNFMPSELLGVYSQRSEDSNIKKDTTEREYSYQYQLFNKDKELIEDSGELLHNSTYDIRWDESYDKYELNTPIASNELYYVRYYVKSQNGLLKYSPMYKIIDCGDALPADIDGKLAVKNNFDNGYIEITFVDNDNAAPMSGTYELYRCHKDKWELLHKFTSLGGNPSDWSYKDMTTEHGLTYRYAVRQYNASNNIKSARKEIELVYDWYLEKYIPGESIVSEFEDAFLYDGHRQLHIKYNPKVSSFKTDILEQKTDTIGSQYPFFFRNGNTNYKDFPISGLISYLSDNGELFKSYTSIDIEHDMHHRETTLSGKIGVYVPQVSYDENKHYYIKSGTKYKSVKVRPEEFEPLKYFALEYKDGKKDEQSLPTRSHTTYNIKAERQFKLDVLAWLNNGKPKLFRSPQEGNYIVRLMNVSLTPNDQLGRMLHTFNCNAYEIDKFSLSNLKANGIWDAESEKVELRQMLYTTFRSLNESDKREDNPKFRRTLEYNVNLIELLDNKIGYASYIEITDMLPGTIVEINSNDFAIGATGTFTFELDNEIKSVIIKNPRVINVVDEEDKFVDFDRDRIALDAGQVTIGYDGYGESTFDRYKNMELKMIPTRQFYGRNRDILNPVDTDNILDPTYQQDKMLGDTMNDLCHEVITIPYARFIKRDIEAIYWDGTGYIDWNDANSIKENLIHFAFTPFDHGIPERINSLANIDTDTLYEIRVPNNMIIDFPEDGEPDPNKYVLNRDYYLDRNLNKYFPIQGSYLDFKYNDGTLWNKDQINYKVYFYNIDDGGVDLRDTWMIEYTNLQNEDIDCIKLGCGLKAEITYNVLELEYNGYYDTPEKDRYYAAKEAWEESQELISRDEVLNRYKDYIYAINKKDDQFKKEHGLKEE